MLSEHKLGFLPGSYPRAWKKEECSQKLKVWMRKSWKNYIGILPELRKPRFQLLATMSAKSTTLGVNPIRYHTMQSPRPCHHPSPLSMMHQRLMTRQCNASPRTQEARHTHTEYPWAHCLQSHGTKHLPPQRTSSLRLARLGQQQKHWELGLERPLSFPLREGRTSATALLAAPVEVGTMLRAASPARRRSQWLASSSLWSPVQGWVVVMVPLTIPAVDCRRFEINKVVCKSSELYGFIAVSGNLCICLCRTVERI